MKSQIRLIFIFSASFILLVDGIGFAGLWQDFASIRNVSFVLVFWMVPLAFIVGLLLSVKRMPADNQPGFFAGFFVFTGIFLSVYIPKLFYLAFTLVEYIVKLLSLPFHILLAGPGGSGGFLPGAALDFISIAALPLSLLAFFMILGGIAFGRFNFRVRPVEIRSPDLPDSFEGFRLVHISDLHLGSLHGHREKIGKAIELINGESPDMVLFTGDLVNNLAVEADEWTGLLSGINSKHGSYSILGNHDYGDYYNWPDKASKEENMEKLYRAHRESGFTLLLNENARIREDGQEIFVAGVENWGLPPFKQYGNLAKAMKNIPEGAFTILLSHDPSHWDEEVLGKTSIQLTLSGHTHGMQFGIRTRALRWSPIQIKYPRWVGLYRQGHQHLYVNPGLGYIGYAGRIFIPPEITLITLKKLPVKPG